MIRVSARTKAEILFDKEIPTGAEIVDAHIGPFRLNEVPNLRIVTTGVEPKDSLVWGCVRLDDIDSYGFVYVIQNYGNRPARMTIKRLR
jgi:hypothetical protein